MKPARQPFLVLASASPIRRSLLTQIGFHFEVDPANIPEEGEVSPIPAKRALNLSRAKAESVSRRHPGQLVLGSDQIIDLRGEFLEKPESSSAVLDHLRRLNGQAHTFTCGAAFYLNGQEVGAFVDRATVVFHQVDDGELVRYAATGEGIGCAGAYQLEGAAARFIQVIAGSHFTVYGLPLLMVVDFVRRSGYLPQILGV